MKYLLIALSILTLTTVAFAQNSDPLPPGTYQNQNKCSECRYNKATDTLTCDCEKSDGGWNYHVKLDGAMACVNRGYDIANVNGQLVCQQPKSTTESIISK
jgi:hypothetical protein